jgi:cobalt-zinc-cadmium efflux system outer membrane protein
MNTIWNSIFFQSTRRWGMICVIVFGITFSANGQVVPSDLGVKQAVEYALKHHPELNKIDYELQSAAYQRVQLWSLPDPEIAYAREGINSGDFVEQRWVVSQNFPNPLARYYSYQAVDEEVAALEAQRDKKAWEIKSGVKNAYAELAYQLRNVQLAQESIAMAERLNEAVQMRSRAGMATGMDELKAELQVQSSQNKRSLAVQKMHEARYNLFTQMGLNTDEQSYGISFTDSLVFFESKINQDELLERLENQPGIMVEDRQIAMREFEVKAAKAAYLPDFSVSVFRQDFGNGFDFSGIEAGVKVPLWFFINQKPTVDAARMNVKARKEVRRGMLLSLKEKNEIAWHGYQQARETINRYKEVQEQANEELMMLTRSAYENGEIDLLELLDTQRSYLNFRQEYLTALINYYQRVIELEQFVRADIAFKQQF